MRLPFRLSSCLAALILFQLAQLPIQAADPAPTPEAREFFETKVRPTLAKRCYSCHADAHMGGLDLTSRQGILKGGNSGPAIVPGDPQSSLVIQAITYTHPRLKMPLGQPQLPPEEIGDLSAWIKNGAIWPDEGAPTQAPTKSAAYTITAEQRAFWAFQPIGKPSPPAVTREQWVQSPIDQFVLSAMESRGIEPVKQADKRTLIRRAYYDLAGLPPSQEEVVAFVKDSSPGAFAKVVDRLLASPRYGERWGRYWLDLARYSDDQLETEKELPYPNAFRYRDWVIQAFNEDMPYDLFVKAQIAGDLVDPSKVSKLAPGLGFYALSPDSSEDRVDVTTRAFLGLTAGCAQCHNHKFDPIPTKDYYSLLGIFTSTKKSEFELAPENVVKEYKLRQKAVDDKQAQIRDYLRAQADQLAEVLAGETAQYVRAARQVLAPGKPAAARADLGQVAQQGNLDREVLERWVRYLEHIPKDHPYLNDWNDDAKFDPDKFQQQVLDVIKERKSVDQTNVIRRAEAQKSSGSKGGPELVALKPASYYLWRDLFFNDFYGNEFKQEDDGLLYFGPNRGYYSSDGTVERFLGGIWKSHLDTLRSELAKLKSELPPAYAFAQIIKDADQPKNERVRISGNADNLGEEAPRHFLSILCAGEPPPYQKGSGRLELAEDIASPKNPLTARVIVNRIWQYHFGAGIVRTPSDFGSMGDRPSNPVLLDYLASRFVEEGWSIKKLNREIMLSAVYALSSENSEKNFGIDPENRLLWRANIRRLDAESLRDSLLAASGELDLQAGGPPQWLDDQNNHRRTVYGFVSRWKTDRALTIFDFPNPNATSEKRGVTITPPQQLFFMNSDFVSARAKALAARVAGDAKEDAAARIARAYQVVFQRQPAPAELRLALDYLQGDEGRWPSYIRALLNSNEFLFVD
jgi:Protein of unknown function (DUF1553)/Protein of unknown function (DUF1549)/Planctomycete cytochrome C